jgi:kynurenine formamidase
VDIYRYYQELGRKSFEPAGHSAIPLSDLKKCLEWQGTTLKRGDILIMRTGWTRAYYDADEETLTKWQEVGMDDNHAFAGVECKEEVLEWLWDSHFAAIVSDSVGFSGNQHWPHKTASDVLSFYSRLLKNGQRQKARSSYTKLS